MQNIVPFTPLPPPKKEKEKKRVRLTIINIDKHNKLKFSNTDQYKIEKNSCVSKE